MSPLVNSPYNQWDAAITVEVAVSDHGDGPLDEIYTRIDDWEPADSLCLVAAQVAPSGADGGRGDRAGGRPPSATISPDHVGGQVQDGSNELNIKLKLKCTLLLNCNFYLYQIFLFFGSSCF